MKYFRVASCIIICFLLCGLVCHCESKVVLTRPPKDTTVCRGSDVIINCGHNSTTSFDTVWGFNGSQATSVVNNRMYGAINQTLTIFSINYTTTVRCAVRITVSSMVLTGTATVTVVDKPVIEITAIGGCGYVSVSWTATGNIDVCRPVQYNVTLSSSMINMNAVVTSMNTHRFTGLPDDTQFTVTVTGIYAMGLASDSDSTSVKTNENCGDGGSSDNNTDSNTDSDTDSNTDNDSDSDTDSDSGTSSIGAIIGGVIGGIVAVIVIVILVTVVCYFVISKRNKDSNCDDTANLKSPTGTGGSHAFASETNGTNGSTAINTQYDDKVEYAAPASTLTIPHQASANGQEYAVSTKAATIPHHTSASGQEYAVSTKATMKTSQAQPPAEQYKNVQGTIKDTQGVQYADLQELPTEPTRKDSTSQDPVVTYSQIA